MAEIFTLVPVANEVESAHPIGLGYDLLLIDGVQVRAKKYSVVVNLDGNGFCTQTEVMTRFENVKLSDCLIYQLKKETL